jgi:hypothetical protein
VGVATIRAIGTANSGSVLARGCRQASPRTHSRWQCVRMFVNAATSSEQLGSQLPVRRLFMDHLHVTHITGGLQIVKYRAPLICGNTHAHSLISLCARMHPTETNLHYGFYPPKPLRLAETMLRESNGQRGPSVPHRQTPCSCCRGHEATKSSGNFVGHQKCPWHPIGDEGRC